MRGIVSLISVKTRKMGITDRKFASRKHTMTSSSCGPPIKTHSIAIMAYEGTGVACGVFYYGSLAAFVYKKTNKITHCLWIQCMNAK